MRWTIKGKLKSRKTQPVNFSVPKVGIAGGSAMHGVIIDEAWADPSLNDSPCRDSTGKDDWGDYSYFAQLIKMDNGTHLIRLGYYRRPAGKDFWKLGSQTTICAHWSLIKALIDGLNGKPHWFCNEPKIPVVS